jgi:hypothetical protein
MWQAWRKDIFLYGRTCSKGIGTVLPLACRSAEYRLTSFIKNDSFILVEANVPFTGKKFSNQYQIASETGNVWRVVDFAGFGNVYRASMS